MQVYPVGSKVWLKNMANCHRMGGKLDPVYTGPYTVVEILDKGRYSLQRADGKRLRKLYNGVLLKEVLDPVDQSDPAEQSDPSESSNGQRKSTNNSHKQTTKKTKSLNPPSKKRKVYFCMY